VDIRSVIIPSWVPSMALEAMELDAVVAEKHPGNVGRLGTKKRRLRRLRQVKEKDMRSGFVRYSATIKTISGGTRAKLHGVHGGRCCRKSITMHLGKRRAALASIVAHLVGLEKGQRVGLDEGCER
jgi:hypothetical protein